MGASERQPVSQVGVQTGSQAGAAAAGSHAGVAAAGSQAAAAAAGSQAAAAAGSQAEVMQPEAANV